MMLGEKVCQRLRDSHVAIFGVGGVGGHAAEAIARCGVGEITLVDSDTVSVTNLNRQLIATHDTVGKYKTEAMKERILSINPDCSVHVHTVFYNEETSSDIDLTRFDCVLDCIDSVASKVLLISKCKEVGVRVISSMGAGNKLDPTLFRVSDISKTAVDPLARAVRTRLKKMGINHLKVVYSEEPPFLSRERVPASVSFVPGVVGMIMAGEAIKDIAMISK